ncbi:MAG: transposase [Candidatus Tectomicrobia bacterium]|uniref:Transposase n=1 Tax=Tectimicrobiota bacterium TaxID=2528274 RepID=A0A933LPM5_UNCTE|nr:transposase [Candidatus Tectomicrobia bacterium]
MNDLPYRKNIRLEHSVYSLGYVFFITIDTYGRYPWFSKYPELTAKTAQIMHQIRTERGSIIYAWCVMPTHIHLLLQDNDIIGFIRLLKGRIVPIARSLESGRRLWQRSFYDHALWQEESLEDISLYIWQNPVRSGLVDRPSKYPWLGSEVWFDWREWYERG